MKNKKILLAVLALVAVAGLMLGIYAGTREKPQEKPQTGESASQNTPDTTPDSPEPTDGATETTDPETTPVGSMKITVTVVHGDKSEKTFTYYTDADYLGEVLTGEKLVEGEQGAYGLYIKVVDGERAVYELDKAYWGIFVNGQEAMTGADQIVIHDGDSFKLVYTGA